MHDPGPGRPVRQVIGVELQFREREFVLCEVRAKEYKTERQVLLEKCADLRARRVGAIQSQILRPSGAEYQGISSPQDALEPRKGTMEFEADLAATEQQVACNCLVRVFGQPKDAR